MLAAMAAQQPPKAITPAPKSQPPLIAQQRPHKAAVLVANLKPIQQWENIEGTPAFRSNVYRPPTEPVRNRSHQRRGLADCGAATPVQGEPFPNNPKDAPAPPIARDPFDPPSRLPEGGNTPPVTVQGEMGNPNQKAAELENDGQPIHPPAVFLQPTSQKEQLVLVSEDATANP